MHREEQQLRERGYSVIAGVDEAGRGPLAGPVVAGAVILPADYRNESIQDSKQLTNLQREQLFVEIKNSALSFAVGIVGWKQIDEMGILNAAKLAMRRAILKLDPAPDFILIDAVPVNIMEQDFSSKLDGDGNLWQTGSDTTGTFIDVIIERPILSSGVPASVVYTEADDDGSEPYFVKMHASDLFTGL